MVRRVAKTGYFLNATARRLALIGRDVRFPASIGAWIPVADSEQPPWRVTEILAATFPDLDAKGLSFIALLTDVQVDDFEEERAAAGLLKPRDLPEVG